MPKDFLSHTAKFKISSIHNDIVEKYHKKHPEYSRKADVFRHAITLLDEEMRSKNGQDEMSVVTKKLGDLERSNNALRVQMDVLIKLNMELISRSGSDLTWEAVEQEVKGKIGSSVTKKAEGRFTGIKNRTQINSELEGAVAASSVQEIGSKFQGNITTPDVQKMQQQSLVSQKQLPTISDKDQIVMKYGKPHQAIMIGGKLCYQEIEWEQVPEHRRSELRQS